MPVDVGWTHNPDHNCDACTGTSETDEGVFSSVHGGWLMRAERCEIDFPRCGALYPVDTELHRMFGSCGAEPFHEHPHVWLMRGWRVLSMSRARSDAN